MGRMDSRIAVQLFFGAISIGMLIDLNSVSIDFRTVGVALLGVVAAAALVWMWVAAKARAAERAASAGVEPTKWDW